MLVSLGIPLRHCVSLFCLGRGVLKRRVCRRVGVVCGYGAVVWYRKFGLLEGAL